MPVYQRGSAWQAVYNHKSLPQGRVRVTFDSKSEAEQWLHKAKVAVSEGRPVQAIEALAKGLPQTMQQLLDVTERDHWRGMRGEKSLVGNAALVVEIIGCNVAPGDVSDAVVRSVVAELKDQGNSGGTINRKLAALSKMLQHYADIGGDIKMPRMPRQAEGVHRIRYVTDDEEARMLAWASDMGQGAFRDFLVVGMDTGLRTRTEHLSLDASNVVLQQGQPVALTIHPEQAKSKKPRTVPLTSRAKEIIARRQRSLFADLTYSQLRNMWDRMKRDLGLQDDTQFIPYVLRHTFVSRLVQRGVHLVTVRELAGHSDVQVTMRYAHLAPHNYTDAISKLEAP
jgi:integrase